MDDNRQIKFFGKLHLLLEYLYLSVSVAAVIVIVKTYLTDCNGFGIISDDISCDVDMVSRASVGIFGMEACRRIDIVIFL